MKNTKIVLVAMLLVMGAVFAVPAAYFVSPTPINDSEYWGDAFQIVMNTSLAMEDTNNFIEINGVNQTCSLSADNLSCSYTLSYPEKIYNQTYTINGYANISNISYPTNETRLIYYVGCGIIRGDQTLLQDVGSVTYNDSYCFEVTMNYTDIDCDGHSITFDNDSYGIGIYAENKTGINISGCTFESGYMGVAFDKTNYSRVVANTFNNQTYDCLQFEDSSYNNITSNDFNMDSVAVDDIWAIEFNNQCDWNNISFNSIYNGEQALVLEGDYNTVYTNIIQNMTDICIEVDEAIIGTPGKGNVFMYNDVSGCTVGLLLESMNNTLSYEDHFYNNGDDIFFTNEENVSVTNAIFSSYFDRPAGDYTNYTAVYVLDSLLPNSAYLIDWAQVNATPANRTSFHGKFIKVNAASVNTGYNITEIDIFGITWTNAEAVGYTESSIALWGVLLNGTLVNLNGTVNATANSIGITDFEMEKYKNVGLFYPSSTPTPTSSDGLTQMIMILVLGIIVSVIVIVVPNAMGIAVDAGPVMTLIGLAVMVVLVYNYIIGAI